MGRYYLTDLDRHYFEQRGKSSALSEPARPGHAALFNKNAGTTLQVRLVHQLQDRAIWVVECDEVPAYFAHVLRPVDPNDHTHTSAAEGQPF